MIVNLNMMYIHTMFCTKDRTHFILPDYEEGLWTCIENYGAQIASPVTAIGGSTDHLHIVFSPPPSKAVETVIQEIKEHSKVWMNDSFYGDKRPFEWQKGYGSFSTSRSKLKSLSRYIANQKEIHETLTYEEEFIRFLELHDIEYDTAGMWE